MSRTHKIAFVLVACLAQFLSLGGLNQTVAPVFLFAKYFKIQDYGTLSWFSAAYSMSVGTFILPAGRLGDMYGHIRMYLIGWIWFAAFSFLAGFCYNWDVIAFSICRAFQGIGPVILVPNAIALIGRSIPVGVEQNAAFACFGAAGPTGAATGAVFAALLTQLAWWPWEFWILSIVCILVLGIAYLVIPDLDEKAPIPAATKPKFDYLGAFTGVTGLILINFALNQAPLVPRNDPYVPALLGAGCLFMAVFIVVELYCAESPLIPIRGLQTEAAFALGCIAAGWGSHGIWACYIYLFLEELREKTALFTSAETSPVAITGVFFAFLTVWLLRRVNVSWVMLIAMINIFTGSILLATMPLHQTYWLQTFFSVLIMPGAMDLSFPAATILLSTALPREKQGIAASLVSTMVNYCISCGLGFAGTVHRHSTEKVARARGIYRPVPLSVIHNPAITDLRAEAIKGPFWFAVGLSGLGVLIAAVFVLRMYTWA
jgi:MFS family permease